MINIDNALKIMNEFGYNSVDVPPYLYIEGKKVGINYSFMDNVYGFIDRIAVFKNEKEFKKFLYRFNWYKKNGESNHACVELNDYSLANPTIKYKIDNHYVTDTEMANIKKLKTDKKSKQNKLLINNLISDAFDIYSLYLDKKENENKFINHVINVKNETMRKYYELQKLVNKYNKKRDVIPEIENLEKQEIDINEGIKLKNELDTYSDKGCSLLEIQTILDKLILLHKNLEVDNKYVDSLNEKPYVDNQIRIADSKLEYLKDIVENDFGLFKKKVNILKKFNEIDEDNKYDDTFNKIIEDDEKYNIKNKLDYTQYLTYLKLFDVCDSVEQNIKNAALFQNNNSNVTDNYTVNNLINQFNNNLTYEESGIVVLLFSLYYELVLLLNKYSINELLNKFSSDKKYIKIKEELYDTVKDIIYNDDNSKIKEKYFNSIVFDSFEEFLSSIKEDIEGVSYSFNKIANKNKMCIYCLHDKNAESNFLKGTTLLSDFLKLDNNIDYTIDKYFLNLSTKVIVLPTILKLVVGSNRIVETDVVNNPIAIVDNNNCVMEQINNSNKFANFVAHYKEKKKYKYVDSFKCKNIITINEIILKGKE